MTDTLTITTASPDDAPAIHAITQAAFATYLEAAGIPFTIAACQESVADVAHDITSKQVFMARAGGTAVGAIRVELTGPDSAYISRFAVVPEKQSNGVGEALMRAVDDYLIAQGIKSVSLHTASKHHKLVCFYYKRGFHIASTTNAGYLRTHMLKEYQP